MFDYISLIFIAVLLLGALIGFVRGGFKTLSGIILVAIGIVVAIFLSKWLSQIYRDGPIGNTLYNTYYGFIANQIKVDVGSYGVILGNQEINETQLAAIDTAGKLAYGSDWSFFHVAYENVHLPQVFYGTVDELLYKTIESYQGANFTLAQPITDVLTNATCYAAAFLSIFSAVMVLGGIVLAIIRLILKAAHDKPGLISRLLGLVGGLAIAAALVWVACLSFNLIMLMDNDASTYLRGVLHMTEGDTSWTFAKWLTTSDFGYNAIISFFIK